MVFDDNPEEEQQAQTHHETSITFQLTLSDVVTRVRKFLKGYYYNERKEEYEPFNPDEEGKPQPLMNDRGVQIVLEPIVSLVHRGTILSDINRGEAREYAKQLHRDVAGNLFIHSHEIELDPTRMKLLSKIISWNIYLAMMRAVGGKTAERINRTLVVREQKMDKETGKVLSR